MPLYEYKCEKCGDVFEVIQKFSDQPLQVHHKCGGAVERLISAPSFQFKGTEWYVTDYGRGMLPNGGDKKKGQENKTETRTESKAETKTESKPAPSSTSDKK